MIPVWPDPAMFGVEASLMPYFSRRGEEWRYHHPPEDLVWDF